MEKKWDLFYMGFKKIKLRVDDAVQGQVFAQHVPGPPLPLINESSGNMHDRTLENVGKAGEVTWCGCPLCVGVCLGSFISIWPCT